MFVMSEIRINVRTTEEIKRDLEITARLRGLTVSALINSLAVKAIREEKQIEPLAFKQENKPNQLRPQSVTEVTGEIAAAKGKNKKKGAA